MHTSGYIALKYENRYYRIFNRYHSYPRSLGKKVVETANSAVRYYEKLDYINFFMATFMSDDRDAVKNTRGMRITDCPEDIENSRKIEFVYIVDFDNNTFSFTYNQCPTCKVMKKEVYRPVYQIKEVPTDWVEKFESAHAPPEYESDSEVEYESSEEEYDTEYDTDEEEDQEENDEENEEEECQR